MTEPTLRRGTGEVVDGPPTEQRNPRTLDLHRLETNALVRLLIDEEQTVVPAVRAAASEVARIVDLAVSAITAGGRVHYVGAGTSGRLGLLDAAELPGTYGVPDDLVVAHVAGDVPPGTGPRVDREDDEALGAADLADVRRGDVVVGISASGRTPYVRGALTTARRAGAATALISSWVDAPLAREVDVHVVLHTGPEAVTGSTRMKAATAQKIVLTTLSTALMVRLGHTWSNLMIGVQVTNDKLRHRAIGILREASGAEPTECEEALARAAGDIAVALSLLPRDET